MARDKAALAAEAWKRMFNFFMRTGVQRGRVLAKMGLTPNDARALSALDVAGGRTMRSLADEWGCDASNATWIVDRLEKRGLAERRAIPEDRRVKLVVLTGAGAKARQKILEGMYEAPPELIALPRASLEVLRRSLPPSGGDKRDGRT
ncbi:MAG: MarR family transcriptional regulator [Gemmatimonadota bacterium]|nr:MarR family transcriptional regulator [Gemmatimonadota bacterium]